MIRRCLVVTALVFVLAGSAAAQDAGATPADRATEFRAVQGPTRESVPGGPLLVGAYGAIWVLLLGYVIHLGRVAARTEADVARLLGALERAQAKPRAAKDE